MKKIEYIKEKCTGCGSCYNICPKGAISMTENDEGFLYPEIAENKCIECGLCIKRCPVLSEKDTTNRNNPNCFAVMASDEIRKHSSSGGIFTLAANYILDNGGYVCGAAYNEDFQVEHIVINSKDDLQKLRGSKYFQSDTKRCFSKIKQLLSEEKQILFTGCPCQVAGLYSFLGKEYTNLITIELLCHGVPSYKVFKRYLDENHEGKNIERIEFRDKTLGWNSVNLSVYSNGSPAHCNISDDYFEKGFHKGLFNRKSCTPCKFAKLPRVADITIADWWGIRDFDNDLDDGKGTSLVLINNNKGERVLSKIEDKCYKIREIPLKIAKNSVNKTIHTPLEQHRGRETFFRNLKTNTFNKSVEMGLSQKYDVGVIGLWAENNYGCLLTGYALYSLVKELGYSTAFIKKKRIDAPFTNSMVERFTPKLDVVIPDLSDLPDLNNHFDTFLVGSDQVWNYELTCSDGKFFFLDFVTSDKRKIAYASSLGSRFNAPNGVEKNIIGYLLNRFDKISVRENYAVDELRKNVGINSEMVLDPVFMCDKSVYENLINEVSEHLPNEDYIFAYIMDPTPEKNRILNYVSQALDLKVYVATDASNNTVKRGRITFLYVLPEIDLQVWLKYYKNSKFVVTDSFHGTCFSVIFQKDFVSIGNISRGIKRFESLLGLLGLTERMVTSLSELADKNLLAKDIDYKRVYTTINKEKDRSLVWLKNALKVSKDKYWHDVDLIRYLLSVYSKPESYYQNRYYYYKFLYKITVFGKLHKSYKKKMYYWRDKLNEYNWNKNFMIRYNPNLF